MTSEHDSATPVASGGSHHGESPSEAPEGGLNQRPVAAEQDSAATGSAGGSSGFSRRGVLIAGGTAGVGAAAGLGVAAAQRSGLLGAAGSSDREDSGTATEPARTEAVGARSEAFYGPRQAGIDTMPQSFATFLAVDQAEGTERETIRRMMRVLTQDAAALTGGDAPINDQEPELALNPSRLTVTFGFGARILNLVAPERAPEWLRPLPAFGIDQLEDRWNDGDLLIQVCCEDTVSLAHAQRVLFKNLRSFGTVRWVQNGFRSVPGAEAADPPSMRNLFGQVDGTVDTQPDTPEHEQIVWGVGEQAFQPWIQDGTSLVLRRIHMNLDTWDEADRPAREDSVGRTLDTGAPLTGTAERDEPDFEAVGPLGFKIIPDYSHIRRSRHPDDRVRIHRRPYNYDVPVMDASGFASAGSSSGGVSDSGLLFASYQADVDQQFVPIQQRLDDLDMLNVWTVPVGSAVFAIPPGCQKGGFVGDVLFNDDDAARDVDARDGQTADAEGGA
ncbi:Dyp-type peroxidase [Kocuria sp. ZOR0020]|uniref:Dyp-type peroxidase n=1 Tax=Kocuria sp. ZOR0020 TaxID=1339234 RepID=UPI000B2B7448|nr:Dyp-type peroxidase [Kocuria sp. ZOR0020]